MNSYLIVGNTPNQRKKEAEKIANVSLNSASLDIFIINAETSIGIKQIRNLKKFIKQKPIQLKYKIAFLPHAEKLTLQAQNAFLKTLEEPGQYTKIFLSAPNQDLLIPTIASRCQIIKLKTVPNNTEIEEKEEYLNFLINITSASPGQKIKLAQDHFKNKESFQKFLKKIIPLLKNIITGKALLPKTNKVILTKKRLIKIIKQVQESHQLLEKNINFNLVLHNFFLRL